MEKKLFDLTGKTALVTGGTKGIGIAIVRLLAKQGADIIVSSRSQKDCDAAAEEVRSMGRRALGFAADIASLDDIKALFEASVREFGTIDIVVNNAGVAIMKPSTDVTEQEWQQISDVNMRGTYFMCQYAIRQMLTQKTRGNIVNVASNAIHFASKLVTYGASKAYIGYLTNGLAAEFAKENIRINTVCPGTTPTDMAKPMLENPAVYDNMLGSIPMGRFSEVEDAAFAVLYFASSEAGMVTGETITPDGGKHMM